MTRYRIAVVVGSIREASLNRKIAQAMCAATPDSLDCRIVEIADLPLYDPDLDDNPPDAWIRFRDDIACSQGVLFVTPEYNRSMPGPLKNAIDVGSRPYGESVWAKKPAAVATASPGGIGGFGANHHLRQSAVFLDMPMMQQPEAYFGGVSDDKFADDGSIADEGLRKIAESFGHAFAGWIDLIHKGRHLLACDPAGSDGERPAIPLSS
ncbi:NAD(P)H-dependent oxidoreductase [Sphingomonas sp.]|uniref:NADPH-dependent FMN reductase n=1 Tax=Sphingomonas sp. TaxID=28214 RepID=UPI00181BB907|nr:NAD(P)H-dependent oxidoreductase [Sphingomonas sp.]MBA3511567.1 NAD(P)H-dependent oxidoreductase [Sphingomonas sp.]